MANEKEKVDAEVSKYLDSNPEVKRAMKVFGISNQQYQNSIISMKAKEIVVTSRGTITDGNMA